MTPKVCCLIVAIGLLSCSGEPQFSTIPAKHNYELAVPEFLSPTEALSAVADLQYMSAFREFYLMVTEESKAKRDAVNSNSDFGLQEYTEYTKNNFESLLQEAKASPYKSVDLKGTPGIYFTLSGKLKEHEVFYTCAVAESDTHFYQIIIWTKQKNQEKYKETIDKVLGSFKVK